MKTWHWILIAVVITAAVLYLMGKGTLKGIEMGMNAKTDEESNFLPEGVTAPPQTMLRDLDAGEKLRYQGHIFTKVVGTSGNAVWEYVSAI